MAQHLYFTRDTKLYVVVGDLTTGTGWEIPVLDGFSFSQATTASEIVLSEMESAGGVSRRGKRVFNDALAPAEWSFTTYTRPFLATGLGTKVHAVEEVLWALMAGPAEWDGSNFNFEDGTFVYQNWNTDGSMVIDWSRSNKSTLGTARFIFQVGGDSKKWYQITESVVNEASIDFDIDGIASINWSGMGAQLQEISDPMSAGWTLINEGVTATNNFIRNRLTQMTIAPNQDSYTTGDLEDTYEITLTGGNITVSNNITYITPEELGLVNFPIGHVTGNRSVSGNFNCYVVYDDGASANESADFWSDAAALTTVVTHDFDITFNVGGADGDPKLIFNMPHAHIEIPTHSIEDIISLETNFTGLPTSIDDTDEMSVAYYSSKNPA